MKIGSLVAVAALGAALAGPTLAQPAAKRLAPPAPASAATPGTPLHLLPPKYPVPYGVPSEAQVKTVLDRVHGYLSNTTPIGLIDRNTRQPVVRIADANADTVFAPGDFRLVGYEWGVTYNGMAAAAEATGDARYAQYTRDRLAYIAQVAAHYAPLTQRNPRMRTPVNALLYPQVLDSSGSMVHAMLKAQRRGGIGADLMPLIRITADFISNKELRLADGTLSRNRPLPNSLWLDDLYMGVPTLAQMGALTGERRYFDDATRQLKQFSQRMFVPEKGLYMHGWVQDMEPHPAMYWGRANGWAALTLSEVLDVLPADHPDRPFVLQQLKAHVAGLARHQSGDGFWHQLLDRPDSYMETSATAIFTYVIAHGVNQGWLDAKAYGPMALLGWNAVSTKVNARGQVEDVVVGTGMGFEPAFYYHRPVNVLAAHGYGPVLLAGAETIKLVRDHPFAINDAAVMYAPRRPAGAGAR